MEDLVYKTAREKYNAVIDEIANLVERGRPVLVGTTSVEISELLGRMLKMRGIDHNILNAKLHKKEADIVAEAGKPGQVTIATNMAGRGTDIKLTEEVKKAGGLAIVGTERHDSRRVDRQLRGRAGRQGDVGSTQFYVALDDNLMRIFGSDRIAKMMDRMGLKEGEVIQHSMITKSIERAQKKVEENNFGIRKRLLEYDDVMNQQRPVIYDMRNQSLHGENMKDTVMEFIEDFIDDDLNEQVEETGGQTIFQTVNFSFEFNEFFGIFDPAVTGAWDPAVQGTPEQPGPTYPSCTPVPSNGECGRFRNVLAGPFWFEDTTSTPIVDVIVEGFTVTDGECIDVTAEFEILQIYGTSSTVGLTGPGNYIKYDGTTVPAVGYAYDSFLLVNKSYRLWQKCRCLLLLGFS